MAHVGEYILGHQRTQTARRKTEFDLKPLVEGTVERKKSFRKKEMNPNGINKLSNGEKKCEVKLPFLHVNLS